MPEESQRGLQHWPLADRDRNRSSSLISLAKGADHELRIEIVEPSEENGFTRRSASTPATFDVSTVPLPIPVRYGSYPLAEQLQGDGFFLALRQPNRRGRECFASRS